MNKKEAIDKIKNIGTLKINDTVLHQQFEMVDKNKVLDIISQIDEPKKVVVPKFVAYWYEENKDDLEYNLYKLCTDFREQKLREDFHGWFNDDNNKSIETLVLMHKFCYEVEKEKLYTVEIPNPNSKYCKTYLGRNKYGEVELFNWNGYSSIDFADNWKQEDNAHLTESEIKKDFDWAWQFAEEVEE